MRIKSAEFWDAILCKILETISSVKVWVIFAVICFCAWLTAHLIAKEAWQALGAVATIFTGTIAPIVMMREGFKMTLANKKNSNGVCSKCKESMTPCPNCGGGSDGGSKSASDPDGQKVHHYVHDGNDPKQFL